MSREDSGIQDSMIRVLRLAFGNKPSEQIITGATGMLAFLEATSVIKSNVAEEISAALQKLFDGDDGGTPSGGGGESLSNVVQLFPKEGGGDAYVSDLPYLVVLCAMLVVKNILVAGSPRRQKAA